MNPNRRNQLQKAEKSAAESAEKSAAKKALQKRCKIAPKNRKTEAPANPFLGKAGASVIGFRVSGSRRTSSGVEQTLLSAGPPTKLFRRKRSLQRFRPSLGL